MPDAFPTETDVDTSHLGIYLYFRYATRVQWNIVYHVRLKIVISSVEKTLNMFFLNNLQYLHSLLQSHGNFSLKRYHLTN